MTKVEQTTAAHYTHGSLEAAILQGLTAAGKDLDRLTPADLGPIDEFHIGGRQATTEFAEQLGVQRGLKLLEIGSGLGGAARYFAHALDCRVTGIDLTEEYVGVAERFSERVGLGGRVSFRKGSGLALPFAAGSFDGAYMLHVGMNVADKGALFSEARRAIKPGGVFGVYDVMRDAEGALTYPVPWAVKADDDFIDSPAAYRRLLQKAGFQVEKERNRRELCDRILPSHARADRTGRTTAA